MTTLKQIDKKIADFTTNRNKLRDMAHTIAMDIFRHAAPTAIADCSGTGDCTRALKLVSAMPTSWGTQMVTWFKLFTPIEMNVKAGNVGFSRAYKNEKDADKKAAFWNIEQANETPFYEATPEAPIKEEIYDLSTIEKAIGAIIAKTAKAEKDGKIKAEDLSPVNAAISLLSKLNLKSVVMVEANDSGAKGSEGLAKAA